MYATTATTVDELADLFGGINVNSNGAEPCKAGYVTYPRRKAHHELWFDYPAFQLLESGECPELPAPYLVDHRKKPDPDTFAPRSGLDLQVSHVLDPKAKPVDASHLEPVSSTSPISTFFTTVDLLAKVPGRSTLSILAYTDKRGMHVRVQVTFDSALDTTTETWDFSMDEWAELLTIPRPWVVVLSDVVYRKTDRTFLAANYFLEERNVAFFDIDALGLEIRWMSKPPRSACQLLWRRLRVAATNEEVTKDSFVNGVCQVSLPCGHITQMSENERAGPNEARCLAARCEGCGESVLQASDLEEAKAAHLTAHMQSFAHAQGCWREYNVPPTAEDCGSIKVGVLAAALRDAMRSVVVPELLESQYTAFHCCEETQVAVRAICTNFDSLEDNIELSPLALAAGLEQHVCAALKESCPEDAIIFPPGWTESFRLWITRAVNFAFDHVAREFLAQDIGMTG